MKLSFAAHTLYFKRPFKIAHGVRTSTPIVITQLEHNGLIGFGEASLPPYLGETHETVFAFLKKAKNIFSEFSNPFETELILKAVDHLTTNNTAAKASIDIALHDLVGKLLNKPLWKIFDCDKTKSPFTSYTIGIDTLEIIKQKILEAHEYKILKIKLNGENDKLIISTIRNETDKPIAVDVNQGWKKKETALEMVNWLSNKNVLFVEQPLPKNNLDDSVWLFERSPLKLIADESFQRFEDLGKIKNCFHGLNIKLMKCTGLFEAKKIIDKARKLNLEILLGCMSETSCAVSAAAQLSPLVDFADLDGPLLIKNNLFDGIKFKNGKIELNEMPGIGAIWRV